jgi:hypothetical protein
LFKKAELACKIKIAQTSYRLKEEESRNCIENDEESKIIETEIACKADNHLRTLSLNLP